MPKKIGLISVAALLSACSAPLCPSAMQPGEAGRVVRVIDGDALVLNTGQSVRLVGIDAPPLARSGEAEDVNALNSKRYLEDQALGREVRLCYPGLTRDRYDRALAHVLTTDQRGPPRWFNRDIIAAGMARVRFFPDTLGAVEQLYTAEDQARAARRGVWQSAAYRILEAKDVSPQTTGFTLIRASFVGAARPPLPEETDRYACRRTVAQSNLIIRVENAAREVCDAPLGERYLLRGWLTDGALSVSVMAHTRPMGSAPPLSSD